MGVEQKRKDSRFQASNGNSVAWSPLCVESSKPQKGWDWVSQIPSRGPLRTTGVADGQAGSKQAFDSMLTSGPVTTKGAR